MNYFVIMEWEYATPVITFHDTYKKAKKFWETQCDLIDCGDSSARRVCIQKVTKFGGTTDDVPGMVYVRTID